MKLKALQRIEHHDPSTGELHVSDSGDAVDYLPEEKAALYLELGIVEAAAPKKTSAPKKTKKK